ncbi:hypothetical protein [Kitasatospora sp. NRRL B-11411]|uniref:hypothetical protein n=1 Tax=Kitasatospora sp. NRRL B-11411 TaxID=1463822 RepID=UPI0004C33740|nr:hypothetical protein [Kitasatospora sp. NRRL B-11411]
MTDTFAQPSDAADAIAEQAARLRQETHRDAHAAAEFGVNNPMAEMHHMVKGERDNALVECLSYVLGTDETAADAYIARWAAANGGDVESAAVRVKDQPTASRLALQRAEAKVVDALREAGTEGLSRKELDPLLGRLGWREEDRWLKKAIVAGTVVERRYGRSTRYVYTASASLPAGPTAEGAATQR